MGGVTPFCWLAARQYTHAACAMCVIPAAKVLLWAPVPAGMPLSHALFRYALEGAVANMWWGMACECDHLSI